MTRFKSSAEFVDQGRRLTPEAISALQPSSDPIQSIAATNKYLATTRCMVFLPAAQSITLARSGTTLTQTTNQIPMNPGDVLTLPVSATLKVLPL